MPYSFAVGVLNVTVTEPTQAGFLTAFPCGQALPPTSNLNYVPGQTIAASVLVPPGPDGRVCLFVSGTTHVVVDVFGGLTSAAVTQQALGGNLYALQWGYTQLGAPYAAINPYRFGDSTWGRRWECPPGWGGCAKVDMHGGSRTATTGAWVYDCSGFVVAAFQRAGVDLVRLNAGWSDAMFKSLPADHPGPGHPRRPPAVRHRRRGRPHQPRRHVPGRRAHAQRHDGVRRLGRRVRDGRRLVPGRGPLPRSAAGLAVATGSQWSPSRSTRTAASSRRHGSGRSGQRDQGDRRSGQRAVRSARR